MTEEIVENLEEIRDLPLLKIEVYWENEGRQWIASSLNFRGLAIGNRYYDRLLKDVRRVLIKLFEIKNPKIEVITNTRIL